MYIGCSFLNCTLSLWFALNNYFSVRLLRKEHIDNKLGDTGHPPFISFIVHSSPYHSLTFCQSNQLTFYWFPTNFPFCLWKGLVLPAGLSSFWFTKKTILGRSLVSSLIFNRWFTLLLITRTLYSCEPEMHLQLLLVQILSETVSVKTCFTSIKIILLLRIKFHFGNLLFRNSSLRFFGFFIQLFFLNPRLSSFLGAI